MEQSRRRWLKTVSTIGVGSSLGVEVTAAEPPTTGVLVSEVREQNNPLSRSGIQSIQQQAIEQYRDRVGYEGNIGTADFEFEDGDLPVAYVLMVDDGQIDYYLGKTSTPSGIGKVHRFAEEYRANFQERIAND